MKKILIILAAVMLLSQLAYAAQDVAAKDMAQARQMADQESCYEYLGQRYPNADTERLESVCGSLKAKNVQNLAKEARAGQPEQASGQNTENPSQKTKIQNHGQNAQRIMSQLSEQERLQNKLAELEAIAARSVEQEKTIESIAAEQLSQLSESQRNAVIQLSGDNHSKVISTIAAFRPTWATEPQTTQPEPVTTDTAPVGGPPDTGSPSEPDKQQQYQRLNETNPFAAAQFIDRNGGSSGFIQ